MKKLRYSFTQHDQVNLFSFVHASAEAFGGRQLVHRKEKLPLERARLLFLRPYNATSKLPEFSRSRYPMQLPRRACPCWWQCQPPWYRFTHAMKCFSAYLGGIVICLDHF